MLDRRTSSELSSEYGAVKRLDKDGEETETPEARKFAYSILFSDWMAIVAHIPAFIGGTAPTIIFLFVGNIITIVSDYTMKKIDNPLPATLKQCISLVVTELVAALCMCLASMLWMRVGTRVAIRVKEQLFNSAMKYDVSYFDTNSIGSVLTILGEDTAVIQESFGNIKNLQVQELSSLVVSVILIYIQSWKLGLIYSAFVPLMVLAMYIYHPFIKKNFKKRFEYVSNSITIAEETIAAVRTVRGFNAEENEIKRFTKDTELGKKYDQKVLYGFALMYMSVMLFIYGILSFMLYYSAKLIGTTQNGKEFTGGALISCFGYAMMGSYSLATLQDSLQQESRAIQASGRALNMIHYTPKINFEGGKTYEDFKGKIEFKNVTFKYPTRKTNALVNVSFEVNPGEYVGLVGHSGSGKSTCVQLIERFYDVTEGIITVDGFDIKEIDPRWLHRQISLVSQEPTLFQGTIRDNVCYGVTDASKFSDDDIWSSLEQANAKKFVSKFNDKLEHIVGDRGSALSGGQRQRIAIARAIMRKPRVLICDEATSALDSESEKKVQEALDRIIENCTGIVVAHRLSTVIKCTKILVFDNGEIVERGTHESLLASQGFYYNLVKRQLQKHETSHSSGSHSDE